MQLERSLSEIDARCWTDVVEQFDQDWRAKRRPRLESYVPLDATFDGRRTYLLDLIKVDLEHRWRESVSQWSHSDQVAADSASRSGGVMSESLPCRPHAEDYLARFPELEDDQASAAIELFAAEYRVRTRWGDHPRHEEYRRRLPGHFGSLRNALSDVDRELEADRSLSGAAPLPAAPFGDYLPLRELGRGGMGVVYEATHRTQGRRVAIKTLSARDPSLLLRLKHEFRSLQGISHPSLVRFEELVVQGELAFIVMEYIEGDPFAARLDGPYVSEADLQWQSGAKLQRVLHAARQLARAIQCLHQAHVLHRDLKPENVLVTREGRVVVLDFGLAVELHGAAYRNSVKDRVGTFAYMSPEQQQGKSLSPASDWYSFGVMLYQALTGSRPFAAESLDELLQKKLSEPPVPPHALAPSVPPELSALCCDLLAAAPSQRPSGADVAARLGGNWDPGPSPARPAWAGREKALDWLAGALGEVRRGEGVTLFVHGQSGVGKTALINRFLERSCDSPHVVILCGKCYENERVAYKGFDALIDALAKYLARLPDERVERVMPLEVECLCRLFPVLSQVSALHQARRTTQSFDAQDVRQRGFDALRQLLCRLARFQDLILFLDDLHWGGRDSAELLAHLLQTPDAPVCLTLGAFRSEEPESEFLKSLREHPATREGRLAWRDYPLDRLSDREAEELAGALLGETADPKTARRLAAESQGHPLLVRMLAETAPPATDLPQRGEPRPLDAAVMSLVEALPVEQRRLLRLLSVAGGPVDCVALAHAAGLPGEYQGLSELRSRRLIRTIGGQGREVDVFHDKFREIIAQHLGSEWSALSLELAGALEGAGQNSALLGQLFLQGGQPEKAGRYFWQAAHDAHAGFAFHRAIDLYRLAIQELQPQGAQEAQIRKSLAEALVQAGHTSDAAEQYLQAAFLADGRASADLRCHAARCLLTSGHIDSGVRTLQDVLSDVGIRYPGSTKFATASLLWHSCRIRMRGLSHPQRPSESLSERDRRKLQAHWTAVAGLSVIDPVRAADFASRYLLNALRLGDLTHLERAITAHLGHVAAVSYRNRRRVDALLARIEAIARTDGKPYGLAIAAIASGVAAHVQSAYAESVRHCDQAVAGLLDPQSRGLDERCLDVTWELNLARSFAMWSLMYLGDIAELARRQPEALRLAEERNDLFATLNFGTQIMTYVLLGRDRPAEARRRLEEDGQKLSKLGYFVQHQNHLLAMALLDQYCGDGRSAWRRVQDAQRASSNSVLSHVQHMRIDFLQAHGRAALAAAQSGGDAAVVKQAERAARRLRHEGTPWAAAMSAFLDAGIAAVCGQADVQQRLTTAIAKLIEVDARLFAAAAKIRLAQARKSGVEQAADEMRRLGVRNPERMTAALLPGFK